MNKIAYKVCLEMVNPLDTRYVSAMGSELPSEFVLRYKIGQKTTAKSGRIFVFNSLDNAKIFLNKLCFCGRIERRSVFEGLAENVGIPKFVSNDYINHSGLLAFWFGKKRHKSLSNNYVGKQAPSGSLTCQSFTPHKMVYSQLLN